MLLNLIQSFQNKMALRFLTLSRTADKLSLSCLRQHQPSVWRNFERLSSAKPLALSEFAESVLSRCKPPKGFEKFFKDKKPAPKRDAAGSGEAAPKKEAPTPPSRQMGQSQKKSGPDFKFEFKFGQTGGGKGSNPFGEPGSDKNVWVTAGVLGAGALALMYGADQMNYREITWKEFVNNHLARGNVERLTVVNNKWVKVELNTGVGDGSKLWFTIGSVDTFERNLENAQADLQIDTAQFVPVLYKSQIEMSSVMGALPTLLLIGFLIWSFR